jgi:hypothetical protein
MKFNLVYTTQLEPPVAQARAGEYLSKAGYRHEMGSSHYERGSKISGLFGGRMKSWHALAFLKAEPCPEGSSLNLVLDVDPQGRLVSENEKTFWEKELVGLGEAVRTESTQGSMTPWPSTIYTGFVTKTLMVLGFFAGAVWGYSLAHSILLAILVAITCSGLLSALGYRLDKARISKKTVLLPDVLPQPAAAISLQPAGVAAPGEDVPVLSGSTTAPSQAVSTGDISPLEWNMRKEIRSWALWCGILGIVQLVTGGLSDAWGAMLLLVAVASLVFQAPAIFVVYGITLAWAAISNITSGSTQWIVFALLQVYFAFRLFVDFRRYRRVLDIYRTPEGATLAPRPQPVMGRPAKIFPWLGAVLSGIALAVFLICFVVIVLFSRSPAYASYRNGISFTIDFMVNLGLLGLALGVGSLLSRYRFKVASILAIVLGGLLLAITLLLKFL